MPGKLKTDQIASLWKSMIRGNSEAFSNIYKLHSRSLMAYGTKISRDESIVKDAMQDVFVNLWNKRKSLPEVSNVRVYLLKSLRHRLIRILEKNGQFIEEIDEVIITVPSDEDSIILQELKKEQLLKLHYHLQNLPIRQREVIHLRFFQNLKSSEIAEMLQINSQSVSNIIYRGLNTLKSKFQSPGFEKRQSI